MPDITAILDEIFQARRVPRATYRVQFNENFTFRDAQAIVPYLHDLGISDLYASPLLKSRPGSTHGYDTCDYGQLNPALGTQADFEALVAALKERGMGLLLDIVPNHMGVGAECNTWWMNVLENGPGSPFADYFDIDWRPVKRELTNKVLLPVLEDQYGVVLEDGKLKLTYENGAFFLNYYDTRWPVTPDTYGVILQLAADEMPEADSELQSIMTALKNLPPYTETDADKKAERQREIPIIKRRLAALMESSTEVKSAVERALEALNGVPGEPASFDNLDALLNAQPYRLAFWRVAADEINYRRFFDINDMAAIHIEHPEVFSAVHDRIMTLLAEGQVTGLRIDHPDGLWHPAAYFRQLQESYLTRRIQPKLDGVEGIERAVSEWADSHQQNENALWPLYIVAEKILSETEPLPHEWAVDGTTGYDFMNLVNGIFVQAEHENRFAQIYEGFLGRQTDFRELVYSSKHLIMDEALSSEIRTLSYQLERITEASRRYRDFTLTGIRTAIREVIASMSIYRTYITAPDAVSERDARYMLEAVLNARRRNPGTSRLLFTFIRDTLLLRNMESFAETARPRLLAFVMKFQQLTGPVMAKSFEDTAFYIYNRLVSLNEVGGNPEEFGVSLERFHQQTQARAQNWPHTMLSTSTHDTKRSEDVRARLNVLSEIPDEWEAAIHRWAEQNADKKVQVNGDSYPDRNDEYLFYQALTGIWDDSSPVDELRERLTTYMIKAASEAKVHTGWINPNEEYTSALQNFVSGVLNDGAFLDDFQQFQRRVAYHGRLNSLAQTLLKLTAPGVPDIYQGTELWNFSLVDPDNRCPVDYEQRRTLLAESPAWTPDSLESDSEGRSKLHILASTLAFRRENPMLFEKGSYEPLEVVGEKQAHVCTFARHHENQTMVVVVPRLVVGLTGGNMQLPTGESIWQDTRIQLPAGEYRDRFTGDRIAAGEEGIAVGTILSNFPVALLTF